MQDRYELVKLAGAESFIISAYPVQLQWLDVTLVLGGSLLLLPLASWYPSPAAAPLNRPTPSKRIARVSAQTPLE
jgi:lipoprotein-releasing system permease protein